MFYWSITFHHCLWRFTPQLLYCVVNPFVRRLRHGAKSLVTVESFNDVVSDLILHVFLILHSWGSRFPPVLWRWLTSSSSYLNALIGWNLVGKTTAICLEMGHFGSFLYYYAFAWLYRLSLVVQNHFFQLVQLESFHEDSLLFLESKLLLWTGTF